MDSLQNKSLQLEQVMPLILERLAAGQSVSFSPRGTSMLPMLRQGVDTVVLSPAPQQLKKYQIPLYRRDNGQFVLHRITGVGETYTCIGDNQFEYEPGIRREQVIAVVSAFTRGGREISVTNPLYRCYCRYWHYSRPLRSFWRRARYWLGRKLR